MKRIFFLLVIILITDLQPTWGQIPPTISYQGVLTDTQGTAVPDGAYSLTFNLYTAATGGSSLWSETQTVPVEQGIFNVVLGAVRPLNLPFDKPTWLGVTVGDGAELTPRIELTASPYSLNTRAIPDNIVSSTKIAAGAVTADKIAASQVVKSVNDLTDTVTLSAEGGATISTRGDTIIITAGSGEGASGWSLTGNSGLTDANFIGTTDNQPLNLRVNNERALRLEPASDATLGSRPNLIGGHSSSSVLTDVVGATISGGGPIDTGESLDPNRVADHFGSIGGGGGNQAGDGDDNDPSDAQFATVGGGKSNTASGAFTTVAGGEDNTAGGSPGLGGTPDVPYATVAGGLSNQASSFAATVGGGQENQASGSLTTISGGRGNVASDNFATVGGGVDNTASAGSATIAGGSENQATGGASVVGGGFQNTAGALSATVPGGRNNSAMGTNSLAAGQRAKANHDGTFVWADATPADFASTGINQFLIRASGGVGITTAAPASKLHVNESNTRILIGELTPGNTFAAISMDGNGMAAGSYALTSDGSSTYLNASETGEVGLRINNISGLLLNSLGNVGIGINNPTERLDVLGNVRAIGFTQSGQGGEALRIVRGNVNTGGIQVGGSGFNSSRTATGVYVITFLTPFSVQPTVTVTPISLLSAVATVDARSEATFTVRIFDSSGVALNRSFSFIAIGTP
jgi:hypothetical protein